MPLNTLKKLRRRQDDGFEVVSSTLYSSNPGPLCVVDAVVVPFFRHSPSPSYGLKGLATVTARKRNDPPARPPVFLPLFSDDIPSITRLFLFYRVGNNKNSTSGRASAGWRTATTTSWATAGRRRGGTWSASTTTRAAWTASHSSAACTPIVSLSPLSK